MSDKYAALKQAAEKATPGRIGDRIDGSGSIKYECKGYDGSLVLQTDHKNMEYGFIGDNGDADELLFRLCAPDVILELLAERDADKRRIAELENDEVRQRLANAEHQLHMAELAKHNLKASRKAQFKKRRAAERRIAELEARTPTVKLPQGYVFRAGHPINEGERHVMVPKDGGDWLSKFDVEHALHVAGISLKIEGE